MVTRASRIPSAERKRAYRALIDHIADRVLAGVPTHDVRRDLPPAVRDDFQIGLAVAFRRLREQMGGR